MRYSAIGVLTLLSFVLCAGCSDPKGQPDTPATAPPRSATAPDKGRTPEHVTADDPHALEALKNLGVEFKTDKDGLVVEARFRGTAVDDGALAGLSGLPRLKSLLLNDTAITDAGLTTVGSLKSIRNLDLRGCKIGNERHDGARWPAGTAGPAS